MFDTKKSLGQHWLHDETVLQAVAAAAEVSPDDFVLEIGSGLGTLTSVLTEHAKEVMAVEFDAALARQLPAAVQASNLTVVQDDILKFDFTALPPDYKIAANIPYYLTSHLLRILTETPNQPIKAAILVQKEVAERIAAEPGDMSILSVAVQLFYKVTLGQTVPAELFTPPPKVDSQIVILTRRLQPLFPDVGPKSFMRLVKAGFGEKRKKLSNALAGGLHIDKPAAETLLKSAGINPGLRAQNLTLDQWHDLYVKANS